MKIVEHRKFKLPDSPGVYFWKKGKEILYIGRATSLRDRTRSYFAADLIKTRGSRIVDMVTQANRISWQETDSVLEAIILEANLIKKHQPHYNVDDKDDKSWNYVGITKDEFPKVILVRGKDLDWENSTAQGYSFKHIFGPFTSGTLLREALRIIRRMFPYLDEKSDNKYGRAFYRQIGLTPDTATPESKREYLLNIKHIILFFEGKKAIVLRSMRKQMMEYAKRREFEKAEEVKQRMFALEHIRDISLIKEDSYLPPDTSHKLLGVFRFEAYDVAHTSGAESVGVMTVVSGGEPEKSQYRKFKLSPSTGNNDVKSLEEVLERRFSHSEWKFPDVAVIDGGAAQRNKAMDIISRYSARTAVVSVVKNERHAPKAIIGPADLVKARRKEILLANSEAHRFAITYHRKRLRSRR